MHTNFIFSTSFSLTLQSQQVYSELFKVVIISWANGVFDRGLPPNTTVISLIVSNVESKVQQLTGSTLYYNLSVPFNSSESTYTNPAQCIAFNNDTGIWDSNLCEPYPLVVNGTVQCKCQYFYQDYSIFFPSSPQQAAIIQIWLIVTASIVGGIVIITAIIVLSVPSIRNAILPYNRKRVKEHINDKKKKIMSQESKIFTNETLNGMTTTESSQNLLQDIHPIAITDSQA